MDYSQLSDFEINCKVAYHIGLKTVERAEEGEFTPCNNPADAWPIIVDNEISLNSYSGTWEASYEYDAPIGAFGTDELVTKAIEGKNPLRTAMIAFLMKQEHANA
ncbi:TPA: phage protein NinX family protein [Enterobacter cloacae]